MIRESGNAIQTGITGTIGNRRAGSTARRAELARRAGKMCRLCRLKTAKLLDARSRCRSRAAALVFPNAMRPTLAEDEIKSLPAYFAAARPGAAGDVTIEMLGSPCAATWLSPSRDTRKPPSVISRSSYNSSRIKLPVVTTSCPGVRPG